MSKSWLCKCGRKNDLTSSTCLYCEGKSTVVEKTVKPLKRVAIAKVSPKQASIKSDLQKAYAHKATLTCNQTYCSGCHSTYWDDHDHSISQKRCKQLGKPELITDLDNIEYSCRECHQNWESYKSGAFIKHKNFETRMAYVKKHDYETWTKRIQVWGQFTKPTNTI